LPTKLLGFLAFEKQQLNEFFRELFTILVTQNPDAFDAFIKYFTQVISHFAADIQFPASALEQIEPIDCCFFAGPTLIAKLTGVESPLDCAAIELRWLITEGKFDDPALMRRLGQGVSHSLGFLANVQSCDRLQTIEMINILVRSNNTVIDISNRLRALETLSMIIIKLGRAILTFATLDPVHTVIVLAEMRPPELVDEYAGVWLKLLEIPLLDALCTVNQAAVADSTMTICSHFLPIIADSNDGPDSPSEGVAKRVAAHLCRLCIVRRPDDVAIVFEVCLRFDDFSVFTAAVESGFAFGLPIVTRL
jgi:hypothetical protein